MIIRPAAILDVPSLAALERASFGADAYPAIFLRQTIDLWPQLVLVAEDEAGVHGYALAAPATAPGEAWILAVTVAAAARGRGVGRALSEGVVDALRGVGMRRVCLTVHPDNAVARRLYEGLGFVAAAEDARYFGEGEPRVRMELRL